MEKNKKGLADTQEGDFILNESGTAVSTDAVEGVDIPASDQTELSDKENDEQKDEDSASTKK
jgi:hypothetical protein